MELSEYVQKGLQSLADPAQFNTKSFQVFIQITFQSLLTKQSDDTVLDHSDLKQIDPTLLKHCHVAAATCVLEAGRQNADRSTISTFLEDCNFDGERTDYFCTEYQKNKSKLERLLGSIGRCPLHIIDASWRLEYQIKNSHLHKVNQPAYLVTLNVENNHTGSPENIDFSCTMEQLQDLVGKLRDAAKSLERASQM
ncbi:polycomb complex protein BMI-1-A isoform X2 [Latimeria chalumnae]|uniref:COMM domain-containing protein 3 n=1 Tax=Latimeria chalumnae TaxID=7897 RepID=H3APA4_LATCH|nr:PREDICTED: polycomb complex protein BMI-1 isoform X2 [Latimeria chalumnae]|eukprot:XP_006002459.1 PREDICTED: polycomb complex protein BMI-1 isoform X2 [Latimeria chalumnae]